MIVAQHPQGKLFDLQGDGFNDKILKHINKTSGEIHIFSEIRLNYKWTTLLVK
jgi:hypothetical protein